MRRLFCLCFGLLLLCHSLFAQDTVTGAFEGNVTHSQTGEPIVGAIAEITNVETNLTFTRRTDVRGRFYQGLLAPGVYRIRVTQPGFEPQEVLQRLNIARTGEVVPVPVSLEPAVTVTNPVVPVTPTPTPTPPAPNAPPPAPAPATEIRSQLNTSDASRSGSFNEAQLARLPLGSVTLTRSFDELALLLPGVAPPPQTLGTVAGPGQGPGVGTAGQFAVNGLRSRGNNFTVDGSDNNDEDIGVRRQGFTALTSQPMESVREYQALTLLAPAQFGRNFGANVNAVSKSGGNQIHGNLLGLFNASQLNARNRFDSNPTASVPVTSGSGQAVTLDGQTLSVPNYAGGEDSFTLGKVGATLGGPLRREKTFYFLSFEGQKINASQEEHFAVPTVEQRGVFGSGATGLFRNPLDNNARLKAYPTDEIGNSYFSLFPFPNQPDGVFGRNTFTQLLPASARGVIASGKLDHQFKLGERAQSLTGRYNFTDDWRELPKTGEAIFASLRPAVQTQNFSFFWNGQLNEAGTVFNQTRLSYGRTSLNFAPLQPCQNTTSTYSNECLLPSNEYAQKAFLLNRPRIDNQTLPTAPGVAQTGAVKFVRGKDFNGRPLNTESRTGPIGQVLLAGFSPLGVDAYNFPQRRVNNTYQVADILTWRRGAHAVALGADLRRSELHSFLPRLARPVVTFNGAPRLQFTNGAFRAPASNSADSFVRPEDLAAVGGASNFFLTLTNSTAGQEAAALSLRFYQLNFFAQDEWRIQPQLTLSYGLRYEKNTVPQSANQTLETALRSPALAFVPAFQQVVAGREKIFDFQGVNLLPRLSLAYAPRWFGKDRATALRAGVGLYADQLLGAVVSQSRNVYPTFLTVNFGGVPFPDESVLNAYNPVNTFFGNNQPLVKDLNLLNLPFNQAFIRDLNSEFPQALNLTLPARRLNAPLATHYSFSFEQQLSRAWLVSAAYVGTQGRHLLRFTTPNLGSANNVIPTALIEIANIPLFYGRNCTPSASGTALCQGRPLAGIGAINIFETSANSRYDALQVELRGRLAQGLETRAAFTLSDARDDVSDVFDLAGAAALPQNSTKLAAERGAANFDVRHRATFFLTYDLSEWKDRVAGLAWFLNGLQVSSLGQLQTGQPFTVNSIFDVNLDGNLTDRLNTTAGLLPTHEGGQPLLLQTSNPAALLATPGQDGQVARNAFRAGGLVQMDVGLSKAIPFSAQRRLLVRAELFNLFNRANYAVPVRWLEAPSFGQAVRTITPGFRAQFGLKLEF